MLIPRAHVDFAIAKSCARMINAWLTISEDYIGNRLRGGGGGGGSNSRGWNVWVWSMLKFTGLILLYFGIVNLDINVYLCSFCTLYEVVWWIFLIQSEYCTCSCLFFTNRIELPVEDLTKLVRCCCFYHFIILLLFIVTVYLLSQNLSAKEVRFQDRVPLCRRNKLYQSEVEVWWRYGL